MRFGFVGLGRATTVFHMPALARIADASAIGGCDVSSAARERWEAATGLPSFETLEELLERTAPDVVVVATPPASHAAQCIRALSNGAHVICEKPFTMTVDEADRVLAAADAAGRRIAVNHEFREKPIFKAVCERVHGGDFGRLVFAALWQLVDTPPWRDPAPWRAAMAHQTLLEGGVHLVDLTLQLFDEVPRAVYARRSAAFHADRSADPVHLVTLEFSDDRLAQITIDRVCPAGTRYLELRADCEQGSLRASLGGRALIRVGKRRGETAGIKPELALGGRAWVEQGLRARTLARASRAAGVDATSRLLRQIVAALEADHEPPSSGAEARDAIAVIEAAYDSAATGRRIELGASSAGVASAINV